VPAIQPTVARLMLFQRTPAWVMPRRDRPISAAEKWLYRRVPPAQRLVRAGLHASRETLVVGFVRQPRLLRAAQRISRRHLARAVPDPDLRTKLTPEYVLGCKRVLLSNDFYPALTQPNAELVASGLARVDGRTLIAQDGTTRDADAIIFATGFHVTDMPHAQQRWAAGIARRMTSTVWTTGGCTSWYLAADGRNPTLWPGSVRGFRQATRRVSLAEYQLIPARSDAAPSSP
jgi:cation diffusion facilitator CzcD-associated flavoprotein CzcO